MATRGEKDLLAPVRRVEQEVAQTRWQLMAAEFERIALDLFAVRGFDQVSVDEIADAAGVSARTFYRYFRAKDDLLRLLPNDLDARGRALLEQQPTDRPLFETLSSVLLELARDMDFDHLRRWLAAVDAEPNLQGLLMQTMAASEEAVSSVLRERHETLPNAMHLELLVAALRSVFTAAARAWYVEGGDFEALLRDGLTFYANGLAKAPGRPDGTKNTSGRKTNAPT